MEDESFFLQDEIMTDGVENMYLNFTVENDTYGIEVRHVIQIIGMQEIIGMPQMPPEMKGFIVLRGSVIPLFSMRLRFGKHEEEYSERTCIIVIQVAEQEIGLIVDAIQETITIESESISQPPARKNGTDNAYVVGIARLSGGHTAILLDTQKLFREELQVKT